MNTYSTVQLRFPIFLRYSSGLCKAMLLKPNAKCKVFNISKKTNKSGRFNLVHPLQFNEDQLYVTQLSFDRKIARLVSSNLFYVDLNSAYFRYV